MLMNQAEVEYARNHAPMPLRDAARWLHAFMELINQISDGWAYWRYGVNCSNDLQHLVRTPPCHADEVTEEEIYKAQQKVIRFLKRCKQTKHNPYVQLFVAWSDAHGGQPLGAYYVSTCPDTDRVFICQVGVDNNICEVFARNDSETVEDVAHKLAVALNSGCPEE